MFTIITPCLNAQSTIADCARSVVLQGVEVEHLVIDGYSKDQSVRVTSEAAPKARIVQQEADGIYPAINLGIGMADSEVIGILHADDFYPTDDVLSRVADAFADESVGAVYGDLCYVARDAPDRVVRYWKSGPYAPGRFLNGWMPPHPTFFLRRRYYEEYGGYRTDLGTAADYELMLRMLLKHDVRAAYVPRVLVHMRTGGASNVSISARLAANRQDREAWRVNDLRPRPWTVTAKPLRKIGQWLRRPGPVEG